MNQDDVQFIRDSIAKRWKFWLYFWRIPRLLSVMCDEMERMWAEKDRILKERNDSVKANKSLLQWVHVTHRLSTTPEAIRALFAAGKRLRIILFFAFVPTVFAAPPPPLVRNYLTTNQTFLQVGALTNNGLDGWGFFNLTNIGDTLWTNFTGSASVNGISIARNPIGSSATFAVGSPGFYGDGSAIYLGYDGPNLPSLASSNTALAIFGDLACKSADWTDSFDLYLFGGSSGRSSSLNTVDTLFSIGVASFQNGRATNVSSLFLFGNQTGGTLLIENSTAVTGLGYQALFGCNIQNSDYISSTTPVGLRNAAITNSTYILAGGVYAALEDSQATNALIVEAHGYESLKSSVLKDSEGIFALDYGSLKGSTINNSDFILAVGYDCMENALLTNCNQIHAFGSYAGTNLTFNALTNVYLFGNVGTIVPANNEFWFGNTNNVYRMPGNIGTIRGVTGYSWPTAHASGALTNNGSGGLGWFNGYAPATGGNYIATNDGTGWNTTFITQTNHSQIVFTNGSKIGSTATNTLTLTNSHLVFSPDNTWDIGANAATRPRSIYMGTGDLKIDGCVLHDYGSGQLGIANGDYYLAAASFHMGTRALGFGSGQGISGSDVSLYRLGAAKAAIGTIGATGFGALTVSNLQVVGSVLVTNALAVGGGLNFSRFSTNGNVTMTTNFYVWGWTANAVTGTLTLPSASTSVGIHFLIKDEGGNAGTTNITVAVQSGDAIDSATTYTINANFGSKQFYSAGSTNWFTY